MNAIILAAGLGSRLKKITNNKCKAMVDVNGVPLIERILRILEKKDINKIFVVSGYKTDELQNFVKSLEIKKPIKFIENPIYDKTNNIYSFLLTKSEAIKDDFLLLESDLIFDESIIDNLLDDKFPNLALVDKYEPWMDGTCLKINKDNTISQFISKNNFAYNEANDYYKTVNIYKFSKNFARDIYFPYLEKYINKNGMNNYYEDVLPEIINSDNTILRAKIIDEKSKWYEIDDEQDLNIAESIFASGENKLTLMQSRYGGYWRYPKLIDFCYLVNPYFPPQKMIDEIKYNFKDLLSQYPSGLEINSNLCAKIFNVDKESIVVGNGAAELIKAVIEPLEGNAGFIRPTFEEYPNRFKKLNPIPYFPDNENFTYDAESLINFYKDKNLNVLILINPDNPTGNYIKKVDIIKIIKWAKKNNIFLIYDESFIDFANESNNSLISDQYLGLYKYMVVIKSISKSYGIPGLRLGVLASSNKSIIAKVKKSVSIWNINSIAEYYLQIYEKYQKDYEHAIVKIKNSRDKFIKKLKTIPEFRLIPSQANYVTIELLKGISKSFCSALLERNIFIKDLTPKIYKTTKQWIRVAIRDDADNNYFIEAVRAYFNQNK
ncbi:aminotransferase class I/II-fold pyridoxal phosphate-dependent enzyme [Mycoplasmopsis primatum]|uniref:aminotransferase class I/II-fold pyridoxal phosphate-dependent enzyme n=1 Tax=Mycoplasmopsis primatum TaxID=55604 RepID=UPI00049589A5|nr:aminotransferase class I/II-fold pyridoxal phosphate-dependent enzyme [Mycoplasmopsis primatum]